jgi:long-chain acyl-CoA synthetase
MDYDNLGKMFYHTAARLGDRTAYMFKVKGAYQSISFNDSVNLVKKISGGLVALGIIRGDKVAILSENRLEWAISDYAILSIGAVTVPVYPSLLTNQIEYILKDSEVKVVICSNEEQYKKVRAIRKKCVLLKTIVVMDMEKGDPEYLTFEQFIKKGEEYIKGNPEYIDHQIELVKPNDLATIIYTSGTTGDPKGVMLTHNNFIHNIEDALQSISVNETDIFLSFLPLCHIFERMAGHFLANYCGSIIAYAESIDTVAANLQEVRPTVMTSVPRLYEKIYARILDTVEKGSVVKSSIFNWAIKVGREYINNKLNKQQISKSLERKRNLAHILVFKKLVNRVGGRLRFFVSGGAPLAKEIAEFFAAAGLMIYEGYGLTETSPVIAVNGFDYCRFGTVGHPLKNVEVKIAKDGEILTRGPHVMLGYYKKAEETREVIDQDGWFHTGDVGFIDEDGFLTITDRKKNILVTSGGKNIAPQPIENWLVSSKYIEQAMVVGDKRKFCSAIIVPAFDMIEQWAKENNIIYQNYHELVDNPETRKLILSEVNNVNQNLASYETIKDVLITDAPFSIATGELTPSLKIKRKVVLEKFKDELDRIYQKTEVS